MSATPSPNFVTSDRVTQVAASWSESSVPGANSQASAQHAAPDGNFRNVCTGFTITVSGDSSAPTATSGTVALIDGDTGGTNYLWRSTFAIPAAAGFNVSWSRSSLNIQGSVGTKMTLEFSGASGAHTYQSVSFEGYTSF